jgi:hypothetical protein
VLGDSAKLVLHNIIIAIIINNQILMQPIKTNINSHSKITIIKINNNQIHMLPIKTNINNPSQIMFKIPIMFNLNKLNLIIINQIIIMHNLLKTVIHLKVILKLALKLIILVTLTILTALIILISHKNQILIAVAHQITTHSNLNKIIHQIINNKIIVKAHLNNNKIIIPVNPIEKII